jgi:hypothetical protein
LIQTLDIRCRRPSPHPPTPALIKTFDIRCRRHPPPSPPPQSPLPLPILSCSRASSYPSLVYSSLLYTKEIYSLLVSPYPSSFTSIYLSLLQSICVQSVPPSSPLCVTWCVMPLRDLLYTESVGSSGMPMRHLTRQCMLPAGTTQILGPTESMRWWPPSSRSPDFVTWASCEISPPHLLPSSGFHFFPAQRL